MIWPTFSVVSPMPPDTPGNGEIALTGIREGLRTQAQQIMQDVVKDRGLAHIRATFQMLLQQQPQQRCQHLALRNRHSSAEIFREEYAIARFENEEVDSPTIIGAQAANELLNINGIKASFVLTEYYGKIYVSARAIDEVNVQIIMERLGGGGHINTAGTQFQHTDMDEAVKALKEIIDTMIAEGDI